MNIIGYVRTPFVQKFGLPRQSGMVPIEACIEMVPPYNVPDAFRGLEGYSHIWVLWRFDGFETEKFSPTVRPPRLGGNKRVGVFATRSPNRPNSIAMSAVRLLEVQNTPHGVVLHIEGADMQDGTAVYDIKPYLPYADCLPQAVDGISEQRQGRLLDVRFAPDVTAPDEVRDMVVQLLAQDPRPAYHMDDRTYHINYMGYEVAFLVRDDVAEVQSIFKQK